MGRRFYDVETYKRELDSAIKASLADKDSSVQRQARHYIAEGAETLVYNAYKNPKYYDRRQYGGGLIDPDNIDAYPSGEGFTIHFQMNAPWQQRRGGAVPETSLAEVIENPRNGHMYGAKARPFTETIEALSFRHLDSFLKKDVEERGF